MQIDSLWKAQDIYAKYARRFNAAHHFLTALIATMSLLVTAFSVEAGVNVNSTSRIVLASLGAASSLLITMAHALQLPVHAHTCDLIGSSIAEVIQAITSGSTDVDEKKHMLQNLTDGATLLGLSKPPLGLPQDTLEGEEAEANRGKNGPLQVFSSFDGTL